MLKLADDTWCREPTVLKKATVDFYRSLYTSVGNRNFRLVLNQCPRVVQDIVTEALLALVTIEMVVFQIEPTKTPGPDGLNGQSFQHH